MQKWQRSLIVGAVALAIGFGTGACNRSSWKTDLRPVRAAAEERAHFFFFGTVPTREYNADEFCPQGQIAEFGVKMSVGNWLAQLFTLGIWTPRWISVRCGRPTKAELETEGAVMAQRVEGGSR